MNIKGINKSAVIGVIVLALALVNAVLQMLGMNVLPITNDDVTVIVSGAWVVGASAYGVYKNFNVSPASQIAQEVTDAIKNGEILADDVKDVIEKLNRAAEDAAIKAKPIFLGAIKSMSIADAWNILKGKDNAATQYLQSTTTDPLYAEFKPIITESMEKVGAIQVWSSAVSKYNQIPFVKKANPDMTDYVTRKALEGLFKKIEEEEKDIRHNLSSRTSDLLKKVFSKQDK